MVDLLDCGMQSLMVNLNHWCLMQMPSSKLCHCVLCCSFAGLSSAPPPPPPLVIATPLSKLQ